AITTILATPAQVGLPQLIVRETAKAKAKQDWRLMAGVWIWGNQYVVTFSLLSAAVGLILIKASGEWLGTERGNALTISLALIPLIALGNLRSASLRGLGNVISGQLPEHILRPTILVVLIVLFMIIPGTVNA